RQELLVMLEGFAERIQQFVVSGGLPCARSGFQLCGRSQKALLDVLVLEDVADDHEHVCVVQSVHQAAAFPFVPGVAQRRGRPCSANQPSSASSMICWTLRRCVTAAIRSWSEAAGSTQKETAFFPCRAGGRRAAGAGSAIGIGAGGDVTWLGR